MFKHHIRCVAAFGFVGIGLLSAAPAMAAPVTSCSATQTFITPAGPINLQPTGGTLAGAPEFGDSLTVQAYCGTPATPIQGLVINVSADRAATAPADLQVSLNGGATTTPPVGSTSLPTNVSLLGSLAATDQNGNSKLTLDASSVSVPNLSGLPNNGLIGLHLEATVVTDPSGTTASVGQFGDIFATPELDSIALFGTGALAMAGYALSRVRASRRRPV